jgi:hypothetical protein
MSAIPLPKPGEPISVNWRKAPASRARYVATQSESGKISYDLWDGVQRHKIRTVTTPPDDVRLERELADILQECSSQGWDGYDAKPIDRDSVRLVCEFLEMLPADISYPELCAEPNGDLTMIWIKRGYHLVIGIDSSGMIAWGGTSPRGRIYGDAKFENEIPDEVIDILHSVEGHR